MRNRAVELQNEHNHFTKYKISVPYELMRSIPSHPCPHNVFSDGFKMNNLFYTKRYSCFKTITNLNPSCEVTEKGDENAGILGEMDKEKSGACFSVALVLKVLTLISV